MNNRGRVLMLLVRQAVLRMVSFTYNQRSRLASRVLLSFLVSITLPKDVNTVGQCNTRARRRTPPISSVPRRATRARQGRRGEQRSIPPSNK